MSCEYQNCFGGGEYCLLKISKNTLNIWESNFVDKCSLQNEHADFAKDDYGVCEHRYNSPTWYRVYLPVLPDTQV